MMIIVIIINYSPIAQQHPSGPGLPHYRGLTITLRHPQHSVGLLWTRDQRNASKCTWQHKRQTPVPPVGYETRNPNKRADADPRLRMHGHWDWNNSNNNNRGRDSSVSITTGYGLDGPGIESHGGEIFRARPDRFWGLPILLYRVFPGGKATGAWCWPPTLLAPRSRECTAIPLPPSGLSSLYRVPLPLPIIITIVCNGDGCLWKQNSIVCFEDYLMMATWIRRNMMQWK
jgi:hypothetical protein